MVPGFPATIFRPFFDNFKTTFWPPASAGPETIFRPFFDHLFWRVPKPFFHHFGCSGSVRASALITQTTIFIILGLLWKDCCRFFKVFCDFL